MGECPNSFETEGIPKSQWAEGVGEGLVQGLGMGGAGVRLPLVLASKRHELSSLFSPHWLHCPKTRKVM